MYRKVSFASIYEKAMNLDMQNKKHNLRISISTLKAKSVVK